MDRHCIVHCGLSEAVRDGRLRGKLLGPFEGLDKFYFFYLSILQFLPIVIFLSLIILNYASNFL